MKRMAVIASRPPAVPDNPAGPRATDAGEPCQGRKAAALSHAGRAPRDNLAWIEKPAGFFHDLDMSYEVIARKWRPQQFDDVVGQEHVTRTLKNALASGRVAHAYLFVGSRGIGKTTISRIFAKALNCSAGKPGIPCDQCDSCREIMAGRSLDVLEIDGASNNGVDDVRDLRDGARFRPTRGPFRIYIIDEVHMLTIPAFNALLKTIEEPPPHVKFIFATTDPQKLPATITSRCQRFDLRRITARDIAAHLGKIAAAEGVRIDADALAAIARGAEGGLRDAESALDQLIAFRGKEISENDVLSVFGLISRQLLEDLTGALLRADVTRIIAIVEELDHNGKDVQRVLIELLEWFRNLLVYLHVKDSGALDLTDVQMAALKAQAQQTEPGRVMRLVESLMDTESRLRYTLSRRTLLEIGLMRAARAASVVSLDQLMKDIAALKAGLVPDSASAPALPPPATPPRTAATAGSAPRPAAEAQSPKAESGPSAPVVPAPSPASSTDLGGMWREVAKQMAVARPGAGPKLAGSVVKSARGTAVTIAVPGANAATLAELRDTRNRTAAEKLLGKAAGGAVFQIEFVEGPALPVSPPTDEKKTPGVTVGENKPPVGTILKPEPTSAPRGGDPMKQFLDNPQIQNLLKIFPGEVIDVQGAAEKISIEEAPGAESQEPPDDLYDSDVTADASEDPS